MSDFIAALPMYDWPEARAAVDAEWQAIRALLAGQGIAAPKSLVRRNADMPAVPGGIRDAAGRRLAPDPATLPPDELDLATLWRHPKLLLAQTCWGPMELGLAEHVRVIGQPDYSAFEGGAGPLYSSVLLMRRDEISGTGIGAPADGSARIPAALLRERRFAYNGPDSMSGIIALGRDLEALGESLAIFARRVETGGHRASILAVAEGRADVCAVDCRSWAMAQKFEPAAAEVVAVGWTARRKGLPYITAHAAPIFDLGGAVS